MTALDVLLLSNGPAAMTDVAAELESAGHRVRRCHAPSAAAAWPCVALVGDQCPLTEGGGVDVALDVRIAVSSGTSPWEDGVACARRDDVPVVLAGETSLHPFGSHVADVVHGRTGLVEAVEQAAARAQAEREAKIEAVCGAPVTISREGSHVHVEVHAAPDVAVNRSMVATRAGGATRSVMPRASHVTVGFSAPAAV